MSDIPVKKAQPVHTEQEWVVGVDYPKDGVQVRITCATKGMRPETAVALTMKLMGWRSLPASNDGA